MHFVYVDESGDVGQIGSPGRYFALSGLVLHELVWHSTLNSIIQFRADLRARYGLKLREEVHAGHILNKPGSLSRIPKSLRLRILRDAIDFQAALPGVSIINLMVDKSSKPAGFDVFEAAWKYFVQRFENTIGYGNFPGPRNARDHGLLVVDRTDEKRLRLLTRSMRRYNPVPNRQGRGYRNLPLTSLVEDAVHRDSNHSYFLQLADVNAYFLYQKFAPGKFVTRKGGRNYFDRLDPVLCKVANRKDPQGIVWI